MLRGNSREIFGRFTNKLFQISSVCILYKFIYCVILFLVIERIRIHLYIAFLCTKFLLQYDLFFKGGGENMKKKSKILLAALAAAMLVGSAIPSFAGSDGWTNLVLPAYRDPKTMAIASISGRNGSSNSGYAEINVTQLVGTDTMYLDIYRGSVDADYIEANKVTTTFKVKKGNTSRNYNSAQQKGQKLTLRGGNDWWGGHECTTTGTCNFG